MESETAYLVKTLFIQGSYSACIATATSQEAPSIGQVLYAARSYIASNQTDEAADLLSQEDQEYLPVRAVTLLNEHVATQDSVIDELEEILDQLGGDELDGMVYSVAGTILQLEGETSRALEVLILGTQMHDQECLALQVQILLSINRLDAARKVYEEAKEWTEDSIVSQLCEAWIGLRTGGDAYQTAYYVFDEIAQLPSANNVVVLNGKAIAQACMHHWPEADAALAEATHINADYGHTHANAAVLNAAANKPNQTTSAHLAKLKTVSNSSHPMLEDLAHKSGLFDEAASKFVAATA